MGEIEDGKDMDSLYPILSYHSAEEANSWNGWGQVESHTNDNFSGEAHKQFGYRIAITKRCVSELYRHAKINHETVNDMKVDCCCDCHAELTQGSNLELKSVFCTGLSTFRGINLPCLRGWACFEYSSKPRSWLKDIHGLDLDVLEEKKIFLCVRCRESYEEEDVSAFDYAYGPPDQKDPIDSPVSSVRTIVRLPSLRMVITHHARL